MYQNMLNNLCYVPKYANHLCYVPKYVESRLFELKICLNICGDFLFDCGL